MHVSRRWIANRMLAALVAGAALVGQGCSHAPKPAEAGSPEAAPAHTAAARSHKEAKPAAAATAPGTGVVAGSSTTAAPDSTQKPPVVPTLTPSQAKELELLSKNDLEAAQGILNGLDASKLDADHAQKYQIAKGFVADAVTARAQQDWMKAAQLATKAKVLAEQLSSQ